jgi:hypothetical protein
MIGWGAHRLVSLLRRRRWPHTRAVVEALEIRHFSRPLRGGPLHFHFPAIRYRYVVNGTVFIAEPGFVNVRDISVREDKPAPWRSWRPGDTVKVRFEPSRPDFSIIDLPTQPTAWQHYVASMIFGIFIICAVGWVVWGLDA